MPLREAIDEGSGDEGVGWPSASAVVLTATVIAPELAAEALAAAGQTGPPVVATLAKTRKSKADDGDPTKTPRGRPPKGRHGRNKRWAETGWESDNSID